MLSKNLNLMRIGGARRDEEKPEPKSVFFGAWWFWSMGRKKSASWIIRFVERKIENGQNVRFSNFELDRARCVELSNKSKLKFHRFIFRTSVKYSYVMEWFGPLHLYQEENEEIRTYCSF
jgi:hypothetical protein